MDATISRHEQTRAKAVLQVILVLLFLAALCGGALWCWQNGQPKGDTGSYLIPQGSMTDDEARAMLDQQAQDSRITVSIRPRQELVDGRLHMNFVVPSGNNGFSERLEIEQDGYVVYRSGIVAPEHVIEWGDAAQAHAGSATATIFAVDDDGDDFGNPVSVEIEIAQD